MAEPHQPSKLTTHVMLHLLARRAVLFAVHWRGTWPSPVHAVVNAVWATVPSPWHKAVGSFQWCQQAMESCSAYVKLSCRECSVEYKAGLLCRALDWRMLAATPEMHEIRCHVAEQCCSRVNNVECHDILVSFPSAGLVSTAHPLSFVYASSYLQIGRIQDGALPRYAATYRTSGSMPLCDSTLAGAVATVCSVLMLSWLRDDATLLAHVGASRSAKLSATLHITPCKAFPRALHARIAQMLHLGSPSMPGCGANLLAA